MPRFSLHTIAPRLARARDALVAERDLIRAERRRLDEAELHKQWLVDHRDLQLQRAQASPVGERRQRRWIRARARKLEEARLERAQVLAERARLEARAARLGL